MEYYKLYKCDTIEDVNIVEKHLNKLGYISIYENEENIYNTLKFGKNYPIYLYTLEKYIRYTWFIDSRDTVIPKLKYIREIKLNRIND